MSDSKSGFTLIEILIALIIITILGGLVGLNLARKPAEARVAAARIQIKTLQSAIQMYRAEQGRAPTSQQGLAALCVKPTAAPVPANYPADGYLDSRRPPLDPWGRDYVYLAPGRKGEPFEVLTYGADGEPGGTGEAADISTSDL
jgi:general secretion pathway protein G